MKAIKGIMVLIVTLLLISGGYVSCTTGGDGGDATPTADNPYDLDTILCWGAVDWGDQRYNLGGSGWVFCWDGYGIGYVNNCWNDPSVGCWDGNDVYCRDDGGESWQDCYDYYKYGKIWISTVW